MSEDSWSEDGTISAAAAAAVVVAVVAAETVGVSSTTS